MNIVRILCIGDVVGVAGRTIFQRYIPQLRKTHAIDIVVVNGENSAIDGRGTSARIIRSFRHNGADIVTSGNHIWNKKEIYEYLDQNKDLIRPINYPQGVPGVGYAILKTARGHDVAVINVQGRVFMREHLACPFKSTETTLTYLKSKTNMIIVDFHGEATSEKTAFGHYFDGKVSAIVGTHTHVQTADERILPGGTAYITDLGMAGSLHSIIGMKKESVIRGFLTQMPSKFVADVALPFIMQGLMIDIDPANGRSLRVERIHIQDDNVTIIEEKTE